jgi:hypothetical protein
MTRLFLLPALVAPLLAAACAPAPLYTSSGLKRGAATWGEIPRDARGEPVWSAIRPAPAETPGVRPEEANARSMPPEDAAEGDAEGSPRPPRA